MQTVIDNWGRLDVLVNNATLQTYSNTRIGDLTRQNIEDFTPRPSPGHCSWSSRRLS